MSEFISESLRRQVTGDSGAKCGYCLTPQDYFSLVLEVEHITPICKGGETIRENLWLACATCNRFKGSQTHGKDPETGRTVLLFNPRRDVWHDHFSWSTDELHIIGKTTIGRTTAEALQLNHPRWINCRRLWCQAFPDFPPRGVE